MLILKIFMCQCCIVSVSYLVSDLPVFSHFEMQLSTPIHLVTKLCTFDYYNMKLVQPTSLRVITGT